MLGTIRERGTIRIGVLEDGAPYCTVDAAGNATGLEAELAAQIGREILRRGVQLVPLNSKTTRANLDQKNCDLLISKVVVNETNSKKYALSSAYAPGAPPVADTRWPDDEPAGREFENRSNSQFQCIKAC